MSGAPFFTVIGKYKVIAYKVKLREDVALYSNYKT